MNRPLPFATFTGSGIEPRPTVQGSLRELAIFLSAKPPPVLPRAMVADERDCERVAEYVGTLLHHVNQHVAAVLHELRGNMNHRPDFSYHIGQLNELRDELVGAVEHAEIER